MDHRDAVALQQRAVTDSGELQDLWRLDRPAANQDFAARPGDLSLPILFVFDTDRAFAIE